VLFSSFAAGRGAYLVRPMRGVTEVSRGIEGTKSKEENKVDIQTAVHDRERYMLYSRQKSRP
jgi:hypothetical protein